MKKANISPLEALEALLKDWKEDPGFSDLDGDQPVCLWTTKRAIREAQFALIQGALRQKQKAEPRICLSKALRA